MGYYLYQITKLAIRARRRRARPRSIGLLRQEEVRTFPQLSCSVTVTRRHPPHSRTTTSNLEKALFLGEEWTL